MRPKKRKRKFNLKNQGSTYAAFPCPWLMWTFVWRLRKPRTFLQAVALPPTQGFSIPGSRPHFFRGRHTSPQVGSYNTVQKRILQTSSDPEIWGRNIGYELSRNGWLQLGDQANLPKSVDYDWVNNAGFGVGRRCLTQHLSSRYTNFGPNPQKGFPLGISRWNQFHKSL